MGIAALHRQVFATKFQFWIGQLARGIGHRAKGTHLITVGGKLGGIALRQVEGLLKTQRRCLCGRAGQDEQNPAEPEAQGRLLHNASGYCAGVMRTS